MAGLIEVASLDLALDFFRRAHRRLQCIHEPFSESFFLWFFWLAVFWANTEEIAGPVRPHHAQVPPR